MYVSSDDSPAGGRISSDPASTRGAAAFSFIACGDAGFHLAARPNMLHVGLLFARHREDSVPMYKEFLGEVVVWLIPIVILVGIALLVTSHA
ncbi:hypothetical protein Msi02_51810 [Microbispora siamensis]|nr:hypothetical protein Msi02_51810 [Microbispora siamensis]